MSVWVLLISLALAAQQQTPEQVEARRKGEEESRQRREREMSNINGPLDPFRPSIRRVDGKVLFKNGGAPPERVPVALECGGQWVARAMSDAKGDFSLTAMSQSPGGASGSTSLSGECSVVALLPGFRGEPARVSASSTPGASARVLLVLAPMAEVSGYTFSATSALAPKDAVKAKERGDSAADRKKWDDAEREYLKASTLYPKYAAAWYELGKTLLATGKRADALRALEQSVAADAKYISPYPLLTQLAVEDRRWEDVARHAGAVIRLNPFFSADIYLFSAQAHLILAKFEVAEAHARESIAMDSANRLPAARKMLERILERRAELR
jgi:tetratricopeptide (TPR) repeat protein